MNINERLFSILDSKKDLNDNEFSLALGLSPSAVSKWRTRGSEPPCSLLNRICELLNVDIHYLLTGEYKPSNTLTELESELVGYTRQLDMKYQMYILGQAKALADSEKNNP